MDSRRRWQPCQFLSSLFPLHSQNALLRSERKMMGSSRVLLTYQGFELKGPIGLNKALPDAVRLLGWGCGKR